MPPLFTQWLALVAMQREASSVARSGNKNFAYEQTPPSGELPNSLAGH